TSPCPARRITLPAVASPCPVRRIALLPARRIAACSSPCPASAELPCSPHRPDASRPAAACPTERSLAGRRPAARALPCWQPHRPARDALLCAALLAGALLPALLCAALLAGALLPARRPAGSQTAARTALPAPPCCCPPCFTRYSSPATIALGRLLLRYLFPELSAFATLGDLVLLVALLAHPSLRGVPPPPLPPPTLLLLLLTSLVMRMSGLLLLLVGSAAAPRARVARVVAVAAGVVVVEAAEAVKVAEVVAAVGVVAGVGALVAAVVAAVEVGVAVVAAVGVVAAAVVAIGVELVRGEVLAVARGSSSSVGARPLRLSSF
ncbi:unnamed protein product, partial [Closterium sp. NIES-54]